MARLRPASKQRTGITEMIDVRRAYRDLRLFVDDGWDGSRWPSGHELGAMAFEDALDVATHACAAYGYRFPPRMHGSSHCRYLSEPE